MLRDLHRKTELRIGINGFGRIGRCILRKLAQTPAFKEGHVRITKINDLTDAPTLAHLFRYDSVHGVFDGSVRSQDSSLEINGIKIPVSAQPDPSQLNWKADSAEVILECTGRMKNREAATAHLKAGAQRVMISAPMKDADQTFVVGINEKNYDPSKHEIVSNASCTTNCLAPVAKVVDEHFKIQKGSMTTVHSYTNDQRILDLPHADLRRARAAATSMIPTSTGAAKAVGLVLPQLKGKLDGISVRVPTPNVSLVDLNCQVEKNTSSEEVNDVLERASHHELKGVLSVSKEELVSIDYKGREESSMVDAPFTAVTDQNFVKVLAWYDNEWGFSCRMLDLLFYMASDRKAS